jgi:hypothetical protein
MEYTWSFNSTKMTGQPNGNLLIAAENLTPERFKPYFTLQIDVVQFTPGARFQFSKADIMVGTGMTG